MVDIATDASVKPASHPKPLRVGLDIGSTTVKAVVLDQSDSLGDTLFSDYRRHHANVRATVAGLLVDIHKKLVDLGRGDEPIRLSITGSGGLALADNLHVPFIQEVIAETEAIDKEYPQADVIIELGGEDAKITYLKPTPEQRMNGSCAGGTGAFIDQMSTLLDTDAAGLNEMAKSYENLYPIASRCGVFAKTDLQPLINDGAAKPDLAASIFTAVATQTIAGLASGRPIHGTVIFLGGPLFFMSELRAAFQRALEGKVDEFIVPTDAHLYVAYGSALQADVDSDDQGNYFEAHTCDDILKRLDELKNLPSNTPTMPPLFPTATAMAFELLTYGLVTGLLYGRSRRQGMAALYRSLLAGMVAGRLVWGCVQGLLLGLSGNSFTLQMFLAGSLLNAVPGIVLQLVLIPAVMAALDRTGLVPYRQNA